jgi:uncharacterized protein with NRDE domain
MTGSVATDHRAAGSPRVCLLVLAWRCHPQYRLVVAANRDEFHDRAAASLAPWPEIDGVVGGRDLQANGTWFAVDARRRFGLVTNFREFGRRRRSGPSRGALVPGFLGGELAADQYLRNLEIDAPGYAGFNLLIADRDSLWYASNRADVFARPLPPGTYGLSNEFLDTPWPKLVRVRTRFESLLQTAGGEPQTLRDDLFAMLADREPTPPETLPPGDLSPEWARKLSAPFVLDPRFGTRCSTVLTISAASALQITERRFDADGAPSGQSEHVLNDDER